MRVTKSNEAAVRRGLDSHDVMKRIDSSDSESNSIGMNEL